MAELLECLLCGYKTVRCGMTDHLKAKHPLDYIGQPMDKITKSLGQVKNWSQDRNQKIRKTFEEMKTCRK